MSVIVFYNEKKKLNEVREDCTTKEENIKGFLRSLYFPLLAQDDSSFIIEEIKELFNKL